MRNSTEARKAIEVGADFKIIDEHPIREEIARMKRIPESDAIARIESIIERLPKEMEKLVG